MNIFILSSAPVPEPGVDFTQSEWLEKALWAGRPFATLNEAVASAMQELIDDYREMEIDETFLPVFRDWAAGLAEPEGEPAVPYYELEDLDTGKSYLIRQYTLVGA